MWGYNLGIQLSRKFLYFVFHLFNCHFLISTLNISFFLNSESRWAPGQCRSKFKNKEIKLTASVWMGWAANSRPARVAKGGFRAATHRHTRVNSRVAAACRTTFVTWNQTDCRPKHR